MKWFFRLTLVGLLGVGVFRWQAPERFEAVVLGVSAWSHDLWYRKQVFVSGFRVVKQDAIFSKLPQDRSTLWWLLNGTTIEGGLLTDPFVREASVSPCKEGILPAWGCFRIEVVERSPRFIVSAGPNLMLADEDGGVLLVVPLADLESRLATLLDPSSPRPRVLEGIADDQGSSDLFRGRFDYVRRSIVTIERETGEGIARVRLLEDGEIRARLARVPIEVTFSDSRIDARRLEEEAQRLRVILSEMAGREGEILGIDLAFDKVGVVRFKGGEERTPPSTVVPKR